MSQHVPSGIQGPQVKEDETGLLFSAQDRKEPQDL